MNVGPTSREDLLTKYGGPHFSDSREMHVPVASSSATMPDPNPSQSWSFRENPQRFYAAENGNGTFDYSQSFEGSKQRSSLSPSALGSGSQTSLTTYEGSQPSSLGNTTSLRFKANDIPLESSAGTTIAQHGSHISEDHTVQHHSSLNGGRRASQPTILSNETRTSGQWPRANPIQDADVNDISSMSHIPPTGSSRPRVDSVSGQKRTAAGAIKASSEEDPHGLSKDGTWRPRSKTIGSPSRGRIAELSAHLRSRLSYAAARVEKDWQRDGHSQIPLRLVQNASLTPTTSTMKPASSENHPNGLPGSIMASVPNLLNTSRFSASSDPAKISPSTRPDILPSNNALPHTQPNSPTKPHQTPKLAPPVDIISSGGGNRRRRPNPNEASHSRYTPYSNHRRYHSQQEFRTSKPSNSNILAPGTPPRPSIHTATPSTAGYAYGHSRPRTHSQSTLMEQDAIETLLFMSSPENSGYRPSQQPQQTIPKSIAPSAPTRGATQNGQSHMNAAGLNGGYSTNFHNPSYGIESHAGDEIDRMLDQMEDSDSDDERPAGEGPPYRFDHLTTRGW